MHIWSITESYLRNQPVELDALDDGDLIIQVQAIADSGNHIGLLRCENFSDEMHFYFTRNNRTRCFMRVQYEGTR